MPETKGIGIEVTSSSNLKWYKVYCEGTHWATHVNWNKETKQSKPTERLMPHARQEIWYTDRSLGHNVKCRSGKVAASPSLCSAHAPVPSTGARARPQRVHGPDTVPPTTGLPVSPVAGHRPAAWSGWTAGWARRLSPVHQGASWWLLVARVLAPTRAPNHKGLIPNYTKPLKTMEEAAIMSSSMKQQFYQKLLDRN